jgi:hypothetical protein
MPRMKILKEGDNGWTEWIQPVMRKYRMACCDCSLVHDIDFRIKGKHVQFRARRNNRSTAAMRRK